MSQACKRQSLNLRIKPKECSLIDRVAKTLGKNRTDFMLDPLPRKRAGGGIGIRLAVPKP